MRLKLHLLLQLLEQMDLSNQVFKCWSMLAACTMLGSCLHGAHMCVKRCLTFHKALNRSSNYQSMPFLQYCQYFAMGSKYFLVTLERIGKK